MSRVRRKVFLLYFFNDTFETSYINISFRQHNKCKRFVLRHYNLILMTLNHLDLIRFVYKDIYFIIGRSPFVTYAKLYVSIEGKPLTMRVFNMSFISRQLFISMLKMNAAKLCVEPNCIYSVGFGLNSALINIGLFV